MALTRLGFEVRPTSPLLVAADRSYALHNETLGYVPGSVVRGALAETLLRQCREVSHQHSPETADGEDCDFVRLFYHEGEPVFDHFYPTFTGDPSAPLPLTARTCKVYPGFRTRDPERRSPHGVYDILVRQIAFERAVEDDQLRVPILYEPRCPECGHGMMPRGGFYGETGTGDYRYSGSAAPIMRTARTAIDRSRDVAADGMLYVLEMMAPADTFTLRGSIVIDESKADLLESALSRVRRIGTARSRGLGQVEITPLGSEPDSTETLKERIIALNNAFRKERAFYHRLNDIEPPADEGWYFTIDLLSDVLLTRHGLPTVKLHPDELGLGESVTLVRAFACSETVGGWHAAAGLPRPTELATAAGSVFLYRVEGAATEDLLENLGGIEAKGVGRERARGFGRVQICSPFHLEVV